MQTTVGISPKAVAAVLWPSLAALGAAVVSWIVTGDLSETEVRTAIGGGVGALISFVGSYFASPGVVK